MRRSSIEVCKTGLRKLASLKFIGTRWHGLPPEAIFAVIVDNSGGLHPRVDNDRAYEFESAFLERFGDFFGKRRHGGDRAAVDDRLSTCQLPDVRCEIRAVFFHGEI